MSAPLPSSFRLLRQRYGLRVPSGGAVADGRAAPERFFLVVTGRVAVQIHGDDGKLLSETEAGPGSAIGVAEALAGRPTRLIAIALDDCELIAIPPDEATEAFRSAPELAMALLRELAWREFGDEAPPQPAREAASPTAPAATSEPEPEPEPERTDPGVVALPDAPYRKEWFYADEITCPVSGTRFQYLRTRQGAVRPVSRESDFRIEYRDLDPGWYAVIVCPRCSFAAYPDDFAELAGSERAALLAAQPQRDAFGRPNLCGERTAEGALVALRLARACYELRGAGPRRRAGLLHRQAWIERNRGESEAERLLLREVREAYVQAFEQDADLSDAAAARAAYVIGDLSLRLNDPVEGARWLESCVRMPELSDQKGLERMARERLSDARQQLGRLKDSA